MVANTLRPVEIPPPETLPEKDPGQVTVPEQFNGDVGKPVAKVQADIEATAHGPDHPDPERGERQPIKPDQPPADHTAEANDTNEQDTLTPKTESDDGNSRQAEADPVRQRTHSPAVPQIAGKVVVEAASASENIGDQIGQGAAAENKKLPSVTNEHMTNSGVTVAGKPDKVADPEPPRQGPSISNVESAQPGDELADKGSSNDKPPSGDVRTGTDDPDERGRDALMNALGDRGQNVVQAIELTRSSMDRFMEIKDRPDTFKLTKSAPDWSFLGDEDREIAEAAVKHLHRDPKVRTITDGPTALKLREEISKINNAALERDKQVKADLLMISDTLKAESRRSLAVDKVERRSRQDRVGDYDLLDQQYEALSEAAKGLTSAATWQAIDKLFTAVGQRVVELLMDTALATFTSAARQQKARDKYNDRFVEKRDKTRYAANSRDEIAILGSKQHNSLAALAGLGAQGEFEDLLYVLQVSKLALNKQFEADMGSTAEPSEDQILAEAYVVRHAKAAKSVIMEISPRFLNEPTNRRIMEKVTDTMFANMVDIPPKEERKPAALARDVIKARDILTGVNRLRNLPAVRHDKRLLTVADNLDRNIISERHPERLLTREEAGLLFATVVDPLNFDKFIETCETLAHNDRPDVLAVIEQRPEDVARIGQIYLPDLVRELKQHVSTQRELLGGFLSEDQIQSVEAAIRRYYGEPEIVNADVDTEAIDTFTAEQRVEDELAEAPLTEKEQIPDIEITDTSITVGDKVFEKIAFPTLDVSKLRPIQWVENTILPDLELAQLSDEQNWDAIDRVIDVIAKQAIARNRLAQERAEARGRPIPPPVELDPSRLDVLRFVHQIWDGPTYWTRGSLDEKRRYLIDGEEQVDEYIVLVLGVKDPKDPSKIIGEKTLAETPIKGRSRLYVTRYDIPGYYEYHWSDILAVPRIYARFFGARALNHTPRADEELNMTMLRKAWALLKCDSGAFRHEMIGMLEHKNPLRFWEE